MIIEFNNKYRDIILLFDDFFVRKRFEKDLYGWIEMRWGDIIATHELRHTPVSWYIDFVFVSIYHSIKERLRK